MAIHLIENDGRIRPLDVSVDLYESGYWVIGDDVAEELTGGDIYFHKAQAAPSFFGGTILGFRKQEDGEFAGRVIFKLRASVSHKNVKTLGGGWGREKRIVRDSEG